MHLNKIVKLLFVSFLILSVIAFLKPYFVFDGVKPLKLYTQDQVFSLDISDRVDSLVELTGKVDFYPNYLLDENDIQNTVYDKERITIDFPDAWNQSVDIPYGTYHFQIDGLIPGKSYGFHMMDAFTSYALLVDGQPIYTNGIVGTTKSSSKPESNPGICFFTPTTSSVDVLIQLSNFTSHLTGIWQKTIFGPAEQLVKYAEFMRQKDLLVIFTLFIMALYHWILYIILRKDKTILYFSIFISLIIIKSLFSGQQLGFEWYPFITYGLGIRLAYAVLPLLCITFVSFVDACFPEDVHKKLVRTNQIVSLLELMVILFSSQKVYQNTFFVYQLYLVCLFMIIFYVGYRTIQRRRQGAIVYNIGFFLFFIAALNDILYSLLWIKTGFFLGAGLFVLIISQSVVIAMRFSNALITEEKLKNNLEAVVEERTIQLNNERNLFEHLSKVDSLTLLYNKRFIMDALSIEFEGNRRYQGVFSVVMIDFDHFKNVNDTYGHLVGDDVLIQIATLFTNYTRKMDVVGRFGGEEFLILMRFTSLENAKEHAQNLRQLLQDTTIVTPKGPVKITASFGTAQVSDDDITELDVLKRADEALYVAKNNGRNRVE